MVDVFCNNGLLNRLRFQQIGADFKKTILVMKRYRSILACVLAFVTAFVVGCSSPVAVEPPSYSSIQLEKIQEYKSNIVAIRDRSTTELVSYIQKGDWINIDNFAHGPFGTVLQEMNYVVRNLLPNEQPEARKLSREVFEHLQDMSEAAAKADRQQAAISYQEALKDLDLFLSKFPQV
ncbi:MAG: photosystem II protein PsbQ [Arthrospira platensis PCC 7345]|uniref:photosystem II protein PsbQ n=1 Tax=Limnospira platensis TaxID=118562 RepID=UPI0028E111D5|nr:photosystem II protein PsbQ [Arthrospira platensis PCC 7345]